MSIYDPYEPNEKVIQARNYIEFRLSKADNDSIKNIEKSITEGKITIQNSKDSLGYLTNLYKKILEIKKQEYQYEGEDNENVNKYLEKISALRNQILNLK
jgi:hypothetical protein